MKKRNSKILFFLVLLIVCLYLNHADDIKRSLSRSKDTVISYSVDEIPEYEGKPYIVLNDNEPEFDDLAKTTNSFEVYSELDKLGRCGEAYANISVDLMPTTKRERIGVVKPSGWQTTKYDIIKDGKYLYNRCHLIAYQLTGENANEKNLITCTRYTNSITMVEFETMVGNYIRKTKNHVLYRATPIFKGDNLVASGIRLEAYSVEDKGKGIKFNVYIYNIQPGIEIDYKTGKSKIIK